MDSPPIKSQKDFYSHWVQPYIEKDKKILVIISDALRYEIGEELLNKIRQEDRYEGTIEPALTLLPSYTQLGMAALLPHQELSIADNTSTTVIVDGMDSQGLANRSKILANSHDGKATAIKAEELMKLNKSESRALVRDNNVVYIYHNLIDITGDKRDSEERVFEAVADTIDYLIKLIKKLTGANANNIIITADHGFIYQHRSIENSEYITIDKSVKNNQLLVEETEKVPTSHSPLPNNSPTSHSPLPTNSLYDKTDDEGSYDDESGDNLEPEKEEILYTNRRFIIGKNLEENSSLKTFTSSAIGMKGDVQIQIPKSINRLRKSGSGSRFVHGGACLQEVVIPVIKINKKRQSDISTVEIEIIKGASSVITTSQLGITLYQTKLVIEKLQARTLKIGIYTKTEELISDTHELTFDASSDNPRDREVKISLLLTRKADDFNGQEVILRLDEKIQGTSHYEEYKQLIYTIRRSFTGDFDF
jgi:PglZ domain